MKPIRLRFRCEIGALHVTGTHPKQDVRFVLLPGDENKRLWDELPEATFELTRMKQLEWENGKVYYVDLTVAD